MITIIIISTTFSGTCNSPLEKYNIYPSHTFPSLTGIILLTFSPSGPEIIYKKGIEAKTHSNHMNNTMIVIANKIVCINGRGD